jgi:DNA ligase-1
VLLLDLATTSAAVAATPARRAKVALLAAALTSATSSTEPRDVALAVRYLSGELAQRRTGLGWAALRGAPAPSERPPVLTLTQVDDAFELAAAASGAGSAAARVGALHGLLGAATTHEHRMLVGLVTGELRQGAQAALLAEAVAAASGVRLAAVRRALTLSGSLVEVAGAALRSGPEAVAAFCLQVGRPLTPMLAASAPDLAAALALTGPAGIETKLDGVRLQVHRDGHSVRVFTRTLDEVTDRLPEVVTAVRALPVTSLVLDGEALALDAGGRPLPFQQTSARLATRTGADGVRSAGEVELSLVAFDLLHLDGADLTERPGHERRAALEQVAAHLAVARVVVDPAVPGDVEAAAAFAAQALQAGHEGVVVKGLGSPYAAGRRGAGWVKVKPVHTLDLVVLAAEWGHGRRTGRLSNLHLGARDPDGAFGPPDGFVMLGKTFKGLTDELLAWQTTALSELAVDGLGGYVVRVRPELVVEVALDGVQTSPRYPGGVALRFARVVRYRDDKGAAESDTVDTVRALLPR